MLPSGPAEAYVPLNNVASNERNSAHARDATTAAKRARARAFFASHRAQRSGEECIHQEGAISGGPRFAVPPFTRPLFHSSALRLPIPSPPSKRVGR